MTEAGTVRVQPQESRRAAAPDTRRRILAVALELFSAHGYAGTSMRDLAEALGMTKAALYYHFASKEQILEAATEPIRAEMTSMLQLAAGPPRPTAEQLLTRLVDVLSRHALLIETVFNDPSSGDRGQRREKSLAAQEVFRAIISALAGDDELSSRVRARCAVGAALLAVRATVHSDPRLTGPVLSDQALRLLGGEEHALEAEIRREVVAAALRALGEPAHPTATK
jgi:AcrR family transcriptional regulator